jgi:DNA polymerase-3 subunit delta'
MASPDPFSTIVGHERAVGVLRRMLENGRMCHGFLFVGPEGVGRRTLARAFLQALMPEAKLSAHPDFVTIVREEDEKTGKRKSAVSVDQIRALRERLSLSSSAGGRKAALIEEAETMNDAAANALLKTLEEPSGRAAIILRAPSVESVPATIASRCQVLRLHPVARAAIAAALRRRGLDAHEAGTLAAESAGAPGVAIRLLTDGGFRSEAETAMSAFEALRGASVPSRLKTVAECLPKDEANKAETAHRLLSAWESAVHAAALQAVSAGKSGKPFLPSIAAIREAQESVRRNGNPQLALEHAALRL